MDANRVLAHVLLDIKMTLRRQLPDYSFYLVFMPGECNVELKGLCDELGIETIDFCQAIDLDSIGGRQERMDIIPTLKEVRQLPPCIELLTNGSL